MALDESSRIPTEARGFKLGGWAFRSGPCQAVARDKFNLGKKLDAETWASSPLPHDDRPLPRRAECGWRFSPKRGMTTKPEDRNVEETHRRIHDAALPKVTSLSPADAGRTLHRGHHPISRSEDHLLRCSRCRHNRQPLRWHLPHGHE